MEKNRMEQNGKWMHKCENEGKPENVLESFIGPQGAGPCARKCQYSKSALGPDKWTGPTDQGILRSHGVLGVMSLGPRLIISYKTAADKGE